CQGREPADRAREIDALEELLAAVAFEFHQDPPAPGPAAEGAQERRDEEVLYPRAVEARDLLEESLGLARIERDREGPHRGVRGGGAGGVLGQRRRGGRPGPPASELAVAGPRPRMPG